MTTRNRKRSLSAFVALIGALLMSSGFAIMATAGSASASGQGRPVCHPVAATGGGNTNDGWSIIPPNAASAHIDEETGIGFHEHDGRRDVYAEDGKCPPVDKPGDVCPNIDGIQETVPDGLVKDEAGNCVEPEPEPTDVCPNIDGIQETVPDGLVKDEAGDCVEQVEPPAVCGPGTEFPDRLADGSEGPCNEEVSPPGEEPPAAAPPVNNPPAKSPTPTKRAPATVAAPTTSTPSSTVAQPTIPSTVKAGLGEDVAELAATRTSQGLALVGAGALVMLAGGLGMVRRRGVVARI